MFEEASSVKKPQKGLVSIVTPVYNSEKYIGGFIDSVASQDYDKIELIIVNDGSTDGTKLEVEKKIPLLNKKGIDIKLLSQSNEGAASALKSGVEIARGEFLVWPDSDDFLLEKSISERVRYLEKNKLDVVVSDSFVTYDEKGHLPLRIKETVLRKSNAVGRVRDIIMKNLQVSSAGIMVRLESARKVINFNKFCLSRAGQNYQMYIPMAYSLSWGKLNIPLQTILIRKDSHSRRKRSLLEKIKRIIEVEKIIKLTIKESDFSKKDKAELMILVKLVYKKNLFFTVIKHFYATKIIRAILGSR